MKVRHVPPALLVLAVFLALWPVRADATRYDAEMRAGGQPVSQLQARLADPVQRPFLEARPSCGLPLLAPLTYTQDTALRHVCAGPNARSMSLAVFVLLASTGYVARQRINMRKATPQVTTPA
jgi:hypothetical protein